MCPRYLRNQVPLTSVPPSLRSLRRPQSPLSPPPPPPLEEYYQELNKVALAVRNTKTLTIVFRVLPVASCRRRCPFPIPRATTVLLPSIPPATAALPLTSTTGPSPPQNPLSAVDRVNPFPASGYCLPANQSARGIKALPECN